MRKEKLYSVAVMAISFLILLSVMYLGKIMGRDISNQQAYLKEQFPVTNTNTESEADMIFKNISPEELQQLSIQSTYIVILVVIVTISVTTLLILIQKRYMIKSNIERRNLG
jgi:uncharacterized membrane protein AbrB (regulator of aidB expression)